MAVDEQAEPTEEPDGPVAPTEEPDEEEQVEERPDGDEPPDGGQSAPGDTPDEELPEQQGPQPPQTEAEMEARVSAWERERDRHMRELKKRDEYRYDNTDVCPICQGHGLVDRPRDEQDAALMRESILALVGGTTAEELRPHPSFSRCETCDGRGKVYTGSLVPGQDALNCPDCNGQGHSGGRGNVVPLTPAATPAPEQPEIPPEEQVRIGNDAWGRPPGHPHYGKLPAQVL